MLGWLAEEVRRQLVISRGHREGPLEEERWCVGPQETDSMSAAQRTKSLLPLTHVIVANYQCS